MKNNQSKKNKYTYDNDIKLLQTFSTCLQISNQQEGLFNSTNLRNLIDVSDVQCISLKTFDQGIRLINKKLSTSTSKNPVFLKQSELNSLPLHTRVFYQRLPLCLCFSMSNQELYNKQPVSNEPKEKEEKLDSLLGFSHPSDGSTSHAYTFDIHNFHMPPLLAPLFIGIIGSLSKEKSTWKKFRKTALEISEAFYNEKHPEINLFLPKDADKRMDLYDYWLDIHFPDELFNLLSKFDNIINDGHDRILSYNLNILADELSQDIFLTRINQNMFLQHIAKTLELYLTTPMVDPTTLKPRDLDLLKEHDSAFQKFRVEEICLLQNLHSKQDIST